MVHNFVEAGTNYYHSSLSMLLSCCDQILQDSNLIIACLQLVPASISLGDVDRVEFFVMLMEGYMRHSKPSVSLFERTLALANNETFSCTIQAGSNYIKMLRSGKLDADVTGILESTYRQEIAKRLITKLAAIKQKHIVLTDDIVRELFNQDSSIEHCIRILDHKQSQEKGPHRFDVSTIEAMGERVQKTTEALSVRFNDPVYFHCFGALTLAIVHACKIQCLRHTGNKGSESELQAANAITELCNATQMKEMTHLSIMHVIYWALQVHLERFSDTNNVQDKDIFLSLLNQDLDIAKNMANRLPAAKILIQPLVSVVETSIQQSKEKSVRNWENLLQHESSSTQFSSEFESFLQQLLNDDILTSEATSTYDFFFI
jgi:hypothetical protein